MNIQKETKTKMGQAIEHLKDGLKNIRTGRANPESLDGVLVDAYGTKMKLKEVATITAPESRQLLIAPFSKDTLGSIVKGIEQANLNFNPIIDGNAVRITIPPMDEQTRKEMVKLSKQLCEKSKVNIRGIRKDSNEKAKKETESDDEKKRIEKEVQTLTDMFCKEADELAVKKEKEIMTI